VKSLLALIARAKLLALAEEIRFQILVEARERQATRSFFPDRGGQ